jgi:hypothetical protein
MSLKLLVNDKDLYNDYLEELNNRIRVCQSSLEVVTPEAELYRCQGEIRGLRKLLLLREKVNGPSKS